MPTTTISTTYTNGSESFTYDDYDRVTQKVLYQYKKNNSSVYFRNTVSYTYKTDSTGSNTSMLVGTYTSTVNSNASTTYTYTYDNNGYITKIVDSNGKEVRYFYDDIGQLIREDNELKSYTYTYDYDRAGNITSFKKYYFTSGTLTSDRLLSTRNYEYDDNQWEDLLISYAGREITYDGIGNPLTYYNGKSYTFTWNGRQLATATKSYSNYTFTYNVPKGVPFTYYFTNNSGNAYWCNWNSLPTYYLQP